MLRQSLFNPNGSWTLDYHKFIAEKERHCEALCSVGNGYYCTRGASEEVLESGLSYPGTYISGVYNRLKSTIKDRTIENEDLVKCPNWLHVTFRVESDDWFDISKVTILEYHRQLDLRHGVLSRRIAFRDGADRITTVESSRFASMAAPHHGAMRYCIRPENYSGTITVKTTIDGDICNEGIDRYRQLKSRHVSTVATGMQDNTVSLLVRTSNSEIEIAEATRCSVFIDGIQKDIDFDCLEVGNRIQQETSLSIDKGKILSMEKVAGLFTSKASDCSSALSQAEASLINLGQYDELYTPHAATWKRLWEEADIEIDGDDSVQRDIRLHLYHIMITTSIHSKDLDTSIPARGLHGEAYRGHIFWDELFVLPFYYMHFPEIAKSVLMYRYRRLGAAKEYAVEEGYGGAMFPWQSESDGREGSQIIHLNPVSGEWGEDDSSLQRHVSGAVAYNVWHYYQATGDLKFLEEYGAELIMEIARFWSSKARFNEMIDRYEIEGVMGPDEYHEKCPGMDSEGNGLKNNSYTNVLAVWVMERALELLTILPKACSTKLAEKLELEESEIGRWGDIAGKMKLTVSNGIVSQFDGFFQLKELDLKAYRNKYGDVARLDRILGAECDAPDNYKILKQADFLMLFYLFGIEEMENLFARMGYCFGDDMLEKNYEYYLSRTLHGSTLSLVVHSFLAQLANDKEKSLDLFHQSLRADIDDVQCGTTEEGIHLGLMGGTVNIVLAAYAGLDIRKSIVRLNPDFPRCWDRIKFNFFFRGLHYFVEIFRNRVDIVVRGDTDADICVEVRGRTYRFREGKPERIDI